VKRIGFAFMALASFGVSNATAASSAAYFDRTELDGVGSTITVRTSEVPDLKGGKMLIEQRLDAIDSDSFVYDYHSQSEKTKEYHREFCAKRGMQPAIEGESVLAGASSGWACRKDLDVSSDAYGEEMGSGFSSRTSPRSVDYVVARAPSGSVRIGDNFYAEGDVRAQSSRAGAMNTTVIVDNRCRHSRVEHHGRPFSTQIFIGVNCIIEQARTVPTRMEGCIPDRCGQAAGSVTAR
jgi:hypothetical protein